jgi:hypothetical protein
MKGNLIGLAFLALAACGPGSISKLPTDDAHYDFDAQLLTSPAQLTVNTRVDLNLDVTSTSNRDVKADLVVKVVGADGKVMYQQVWQNVQFNQGEDWNLTNGFLPDSDAGQQTWKVEMQVLDHASQTVLFDEDIGQLDFGKS